MDATTTEVANAVDSLCPALAALPARNAAQQDLLDRCLELIDAAALDPAATVLALDQLMADVAMAQANAAFAAAQSQFQNLRARIAALRSGTQGTDFGGLALTTPQGLFSLGLLAQAVGDEDPVPMEVGADFSRWGFFASGTLGRGEVDPGQVDPAYDTDIEGISAGVDYRFSDRLILGGALGLTRQDTTLPGGRGEVETSGWSVSGYTTFYQADSWYLDSVLTWGRNDYEMLRRIQYTLPLAGGGTTTIDQTAVADASGDLLAMALTFGRDYNRGAFGIGPYGRLMYTRLDFDDVEPPGRIEFSVVDARSAQPLDPRAIARDPGQAANDRAAFDMSMIFTGIALFVAGDRNAFHSCTPLPRIWRCNSFPTMPLLCTLASGRPCRPPTRPMCPMMATR